MGDGNYFNMDLAMRNGQAGMPYTPNMGGASGPYSGMSGMQLSNNMMPNSMWNTPSNSASAYSAALGANPLGLGTSTSQAGSWDWMKNLMPGKDTIQGMSSLLGGISSLYGMYNAHQQGKQAKKQFDFMKNMALTDYKNKAMSYNDQAAERNIAKRMGGFRAKTRKVSEGV
jgi:hypothetical protein